MNTMAFAFLKKWKRSNRKVRKIVKKKKQGGGITNERAYQNVFLFLRKQ